MTKVSVHLSCHGIHGFPKVLKAQNGTILIKPMANAVRFEILLLSELIERVLVINFPNDFPLKIDSANDISLIVL